MINRDEDYVKEEWENFLEHIVPVSFVHDSKDFVSIYSEIFSDIVIVLVEEGFFGPKTTLARCGMSMEKRKKHPTIKKRGGNTSAYEVLKPLDSFDWRLLKEEPVITAIHSSESRSLLGTFRGFRNPARWLRKRGYKETSAGKWGWVKDAGDHLSYASIKTIQSPASIQI